MHYDQAKAIAATVHDTLIQYCSIIHIAGSVRRQKEQCKDIEIICQPQTVFTDLFNTETKRKDEFVAFVKILGTIIKGDPLTGRYVQIRLPGSIMLDLFIPTESDYYRQLAIRTGSAEYAHIVIAKAWLSKGWCGTADGLRLQSESEQHKENKTWKCKAPKPTLPPVWQSEQEFFT